MELKNVMGIQEEMPTNSGPLQLLKTHNAQAAYQTFFKSRTQNHSQTH